MLEAKSLDMQSIKILKINVLTVVQIASIDEKSEVKT